ncbi:hypothetical protein BP5796_02898 [Coleophoma crateriformis]|uniref:Uncharacterized protein n=1 Tax=Coleophoma crateriformis TaxID=565419 RepID=A0A3D8SZH9_9HELO|nr:hypothetical protein BP5796_02898 [Coleophoma crateriformis]
MALKCLAMLRIEIMEFAEGIVGGGLGLSAVSPMATPLTPAIRHLLRSGTRHDALHVYVPWKIVMMKWHENSSGSKDAYGSGLAFSICADVVWRIFWHTSPKFGHTSSSKQTCRVQISPKIALWPLKPLLALENMRRYQPSVATIWHPWGSAIDRLIPWALEYGLTISNACCRRCCAFGLGSSLSASRSCAELGAGAPSCCYFRCFNGIMYELSHYEKEKQLELTRELTELSSVGHQKLDRGALRAETSGASATVDLEGVLTTPEQPEEFVAKITSWFIICWADIRGEYGLRGMQLEYNRV